MSSKSYSQEVEELGFRFRLSYPGNMLVITTQHHLPERINWMEDIYGS